MFQISGVSDKFWNKTEFVKFLSQNQNQHIELNTTPEAVCLHSLGVYDLLDAFNFASVTIHTWNPLEHHLKYNIHLRSHNFWFDRITQIDSALHDWDESRVFLCLYHRPTAARLALASYARQLNSIVHFSAETDANNIVQFELDKLLEYDIYSVPRAAELITNLPLLIKPKDRVTAFHGYDYTDPLTELYRSVLIDLVVESHVKGQTFFPTEKTIRPILLKKPFILFGSCNYLDYLHQMGFLTFNDFWDEDYDGYEQGDRLRRIYRVIDQISAKTTQQLITMYWDMKYVLDHNYDLLVSKKFKRKITPI